MKYLARYKLLKFSFHFSKREGEIYPLQIDLATLNVFFFFLEMCLQPRLETKNHLTSPKQVNQCYSNSGTTFMAS